MADRETILKALRKAHEAGDTAAAARLAKLAAQAQPAPEPVQPPTDTTRDMARSATQGMLMGFGDEYFAGLSAVLGRDPENGGMFNYEQPLSERYSSNLDTIRQQEDRFREERPGLAIGSELVGGLATAAVPAGAIARGASLTSKVGRAAGAGAAMGGIYGFGEGEDGLENRIRGGMAGGALGAGVGTASVPVSWAVRNALAPVVGAVRNALPGASTPAANNALVAAIQNSGMPPDQIRNALSQAANDGQGVFALADALGPAGQRALAGAARQGGEAKVVAANVLNRRQAGQGERIAANISEELGATRTADATRGAMSTARRETADAAYAAARGNAAPVDIRGALAAIDDRIGPMQGSGVRGDGIDAKLASYRARLASQPGGARFDGADSVELSDFDRVLGVKQAIQDDIGAAVRAGRNNEARELGRVVAQLDEALEGASDGYRAANDGFRTASREIDQIDAGIAAARPGQRGADTAAEFGGLASDGQRAAYRTGYADRLQSRVEGAAEGVNKARPLTSDKIGTEMGAMAQDPARWTRRVERENTMFDTRGAALGGSQTADNLSDMASTNMLTSRIPTGVIDAVAMGANALGNLARGHNAETRRMIVERLLSTGDDAAEALAQAIQRGQQLTANEAKLLQGYLTIGVGSTNQVAR